MVLPWDRPKKQLFLKQLEIRQRGMEIDIDLFMLSFWPFMIAALSLIAIYGQKTERHFVVAIICAVAATFAANYWLGFSEAQPVVTTIDCALLIYAVALALKVPVHWPLWFAGFHAISVASGLANILTPQGVADIYIDKSGYWSIPALGAAVIGVLLDRRKIVRDAPTPYPSHSPSSD
jgi:hypothetical protein